MSVLGPVDGYPASYWTYMAAEMVHEMDDIIKSKRVDASKIRPGIYSECQKFFYLAVGGEESKPYYSEFRQTNYMVSNFLWSLPDFKEANEEKIYSEIVNLKKFVESFKEIRELNIEELETANWLIALFRHVNHKGYLAELADRGPGCY